MIICVEISRYVIFVDDQFNSENLVCEIAHFSILIVENYLQSKKFIYEDPDQ